MMTTRGRRIGRRTTEVVALPFQDSGKHLWPFKLLLLYQSQGAIAQCLYYLTPSLVECLVASLGVYNDAND